MQDTAQHHRLFPPVTFPSGDTRALPFLPADDCRRPSGNPCNTGSVQREFRVGTLERRGLFVTVTLHQSYSDTPTLSITAHTQARRDSDINQGGQMQDTIRAAMDAGEIRYRDGWTDAQLSRLLFVWDLYHLNGMQAGCEHQRLAGWKYDTHRDPSTARSGLPCPVCGYRIGSAWRTMPLPADVLELVHAWLSADNPADVPMPEPSR